MMLMSYVYRRPQRHYEHPSSRLMQRVLRFIHFNTDRYVFHRNRSEWHLAVERLRRIRKLVGLTDQLIATRHDAMTPRDAADIKLLQRHVAMFFEPTLPDQ